MKHTRDGMVCRQQTHMQSSVVCGRGLSSDVSLTTIPNRGCWHFYLITLRCISSNFSWRERNRLTLERNFTIKAPFAHALRARRGVLRQQVRKVEPEHICVRCDRTDRGHAEPQPYYEDDHSTNSSPQHVNALGFTVLLVVLIPRRELLD